MKKYSILIFTILLVMTSVFAQTSNTKIQQNGKEFVEIKTESPKSNAVKTDFTYKCDGVVYPIYVTKTSGKCFINKLPKKPNANNDTYRKYLDEKICIIICKEMNIEYKP